MIKDLSPLENTKLTFIVLRFILLGGFATLSSCNATNKPSPDENKVVERSWNIDSISVNDVQYAYYQQNGRDWLGSDLKIDLEDSWCRVGNCKDFGRHYTRSSATKACNTLGPDWVLPSIEDWQSLALDAGGYKDWFTEEEFGAPKIANALLNDSLQHPFKPTFNGWRGSNGGYDQVGKVSYYWSASKQGEEQVWAIAVYPKGGNLLIRPMKKEMGLSCRCIRKSISTN